jgi:hypothetical protein
MQPVQPSQQFSRESKYPDFISCPGSGNLNDGIFKLIGADWITIQGFQHAGKCSQPGGYSRRQQQHDRVGRGVFYTFLRRIGSQNNTIQNNTISLNKTYANQLWYI